MRCALPLLMLASLLAGCAKLPSYHEDAVRTADIVRNIKCELRDAVWAIPENKWARTWKATLGLTLEVSHVGGLSTDDSWVFPVQPGGTFLLPITGGVSGQGTRTERINFNESLSALGSDPKLLCQKEDPDRYARLGGYIGLADLFTRVGRTKEIANINPVSLDYNIDFVVKLNGGVSPRFNLIPIGKGSTFSGGGGWTGSTSDTQTLRISLIPPAPPERPAPCPYELDHGKCPTPVVIVTPPIRPRSAPGFEAPRRSPGGLTPEDTDRLDRTRARNILQGIDDQLRRQGLGN